jgi:hypothetical protein
MESSPKTPEDSPFERDNQQRGMALEASQLHGKGLPPESIGHVLVSGEAGKDTSKEEIDWQRAAGMDRSELLKLSQAIKVDGTTLRYAYDRHLIGESGLRRMVYEHMRGGDLQKALHHEILEHETDFERDPRLRGHSPKLDRSNQLQAAAKTPTKVPSLGDLLAKAGLVKLDPGKELTAPKLLPEHLAGRTGLQPHHRRLLDVAMIGVILFLLVLIVLLIINRG